MKIDIRKALNGPKAAKLLLFVSATVAVGIAATILFAPEVFYASYGIDVVGNANLVNELKAPAGALLVAGILMAAGVFRAEFLAASLTTASVVYLSYGMARMLSMAIDGIPNSALVSAAAIELGIGATCFTALLQARKNQRTI